MAAGGSLLICGAAEGYSSGCGRTSLAESLCHLLMAPPLVVSVVEVPGKALKGLLVHTGYCCQASPLSPLPVLSVFDVTQAVSLDKSSSNSAMLLRKRGGSSRA